MVNDLWRWAEPNGQQRTVRLDELRAALASGLIAPNTPVWRTGWTSWQPAHEVPELAAGALSAANGVVPNIPPPPLAVLAVQAAWEEKGAESFRPPPMPPSAMTSNNEPPAPPTYIPSTARGGASVLATTVGVPPPPDLVAMAAARRAPGAPPPVPGKNARASKPGPPEVFEEVSATFLMDRASTSVMQPPIMDDLPPPTNPVIAPDAEPPTDETDFDAQLPPSVFRSVLDDVQAIRTGQPAKNKPRLIVFGVIGGALLILLLALVVTAFGGKSSDTSTVASATPSHPASAAPPPPPPPEPARTETPPPPTAVATAPAPTSETKTPSAGFDKCKTTAEARGLTWRAIIGSGVEVSLAENVIAVGFAPSAREGMALSVDPLKLTPKVAANARPKGADVRRATPLFVQGKLTVVPDADRKDDKIQGRRIVMTTPPLDVGVAENTLVWAPHAKDSWAKLFTIEGDANIEALRAVPLASSKGLALAFRRGGAISVGVAKGDSVLIPTGSLAQIPGLGPQVGSPAVASSGDDVLVAWADRAGEKDPWQVRYARLPSGGAPNAPVTFAIPDGGLGVQAMSPSVAGLGGGRFLLAWTEGPVSNHQVRAITIGPDDKSSGSPIALSANGANAGQPQVVVDSTGRGAVAFLAAKGKGYEVFVAPLSCGGN